MHISCTICTDVVEPDENLHATRCGHIFHNHCLSEWIERSNTCPQCRRVVTDNCMLRIYPTFSEEKDITSLQSRLHHALELYKEIQIVCVEKEEHLKKASDDLKKNEESLQIYMSELDNRNSEVEALRQRLEAVEIQHMEVQRLKDENATLKANERTLSGEIQRQNLLYGEFMAQISLQRSSLESRSKEAARLRQENETLRKNLRTLNGELRRHKLLYDELRTQVPLQKDQRSNLDSQTNTKQSNNGDACLKNYEHRPKMILNRAKKVEPKNIEPRKGPTAQSPDVACITEKMTVLSQKLNLAKTSHLKLSTTLVNLIVAWRKLKVTKVCERSSLSTGTRNNTYEDDFITRLTKMLFINKSQINNNIVSTEKDLTKAQSKISQQIRIPESKSEQKNTRNIVSDDVHRINDFFNKLSERKTQPERICKKDVERQSVILSPIELTWPEQWQNDFQNAIQRILVSDTLKNYEKNFKSFDIGVLTTEHVKNNICRKFVKQKGSKEAQKGSKEAQRGSKEAQKGSKEAQKGSKEAFEFDVTRMYVQNARGDASVVTFEARRLPIPPMTQELKKAAANAKKTSVPKEKQKRKAEPVLYLSQRRTRRARRRLPPPDFPRPPGPP